jgi:uncharacterized protein YggL (DUF469 family)
MDEVIKKLTAEQAFEVVKRLSEKGGEIRKAVLAEAKNLLMAVDVDETADEVFCVLDSIDVQDCWDRSGKSRYGYTEPSEAAVELVEEELQPFYDQAVRYQELRMAGQETTYSMGVILGIYRYEHESKSEFRKWCEDVPIECAGYLLDIWRERNKSTASAKAMDEFIQDRCPKWAKYVIRKRGVGS